MSSHSLGMLAAVVALSLVTVALVLWLGPVGATCAASMWAVVAVLLVDLEAF